MMAAADRQLHYRTGGGPMEGGGEAVAAAAGAGTVRRRLLGTLLAGQGIASSAYFAAVTAASVLSADLLTTRTWAGLPVAVGVLGSASSVPLSRYMGRAGRRRGLVLGYVAGAVGAGVGLAAAVARSFPLLVAGMLLTGAGQAANQLARYAAADVVSEADRGKAISLVVWGATIGALFGPNLLEPAGAWAAGLGLPELAGPFAVAVVAFAAAGALLAGRLRPDPLAVARRLAAEHPDPAERAAPAEPLRAVLARPAVQLAFAATVGSFLAMVMIMSMTPVHMRDHHHSLGIIGVVLSGHLVGMFALSPVTGWVTDRAGRRPVIAAGALTLGAGAVLSATAAPDASGTLMLALFLVGLGWNLGFVAGSALLTDALAPAERAPLQGIADATAGAASGLGTLAAGLVVEAGGYPTLGLLGAGLMLALLVLGLFRGRPGAPLIST
jgi:MFS family permease